MYGICPHLPNNLDNTRVTAKAWVACVVLKRRAAEQIVAANGAGISAFREVMSLPPTPLLNLVLQFLTEANVRPHG
jgi:hypothetical protein